MNERSGPSPKLSSRLKFLVDQLQEGWQVWDLCCDHGLVGKQALVSGKFPFVHFVDKSVPVVDRLITEIDQDYAEPKSRGLLQVSREDMLELGLPTDRVNFVVAGVGARLICQFIDRVPCDGNVLLVLAPNKNPQEVGEKLQSSGRQVLLQTCLTESGRERWIFKAISRGFLGGGV